MPSAAPRTALEAVLDTTRPYRHAAGRPGEIGSAVLHELSDLDRALYRTIAETPTPTLDEPLRQLSRAANNSRLWLALAALLFVTGGHRGRRAAVTGAVALGINSTLVNLVLKRANRRRPERDAAGVPADRCVPMPTSTSFPSGHSASAFAFAVAISNSRPHLALPLRLLATTVAYSRVHTGVHYPGDVVAGSLVGATIGEAAALASRRLRRRKH